MTWVMNKTVKRENMITDLRNAIVTVSLLETDPASVVCVLHVKLAVKNNIILQMELQASILSCCMTELQFQLRTDHEYADKTGQMKS